MEQLPEKELCKYKYTFSKENVTLQRKGLILYTARVVIDLAEHKGKILVILSHKSQLNDSN